MKHTKNNILQVIKAREANAYACMQDLCRRGLKDGDLYKSLMHEHMALNGVIALFEDKHYFDSVACIFRDKIDLSKID